MPSFGCSCGYRISLSSIPCRYDGWVVRDHRSDEFYDGLIRDLTDFVRAVAAGRRDTWVSERFQDPHPAQRRDDSIISDLITQHESRYHISIHQCERCGRLWLEDPSGENRYSPFLPEREWRGALEVPAEGFVGYLPDQDLFEGTITAVEHDDATARVEIRMEDGSRRILYFEGVASVVWHQERGREVRYLAEWQATPPLRRFVLDVCAEPLVELLAERVEMQRVDAEGGNC